MIDLRDITDADIAPLISKHLSSAFPGSPTWRILSSALLLSERYSFSANRTYPRPDHPNPAKRKPLIFMLAAILVSLRTTLENEQKAVDRMIQKFPTEESLFEATVEELAEVLRPAGMASRRSRMIRRALDHVKAELGEIESLDSLSTSDARERLLEIPGVGPKSADCMLSIGLGKASMAVDVNVFRVTSWLFHIGDIQNLNYSDANSVHIIKDLIDRALPNDAFLCQVVHTLFLLHGKFTGQLHRSGSCILHEYCMTCDQTTEDQPRLVFI